MTQQQFEQMMAVLQSSNHYHRITYEKLEIMSLVMGALLMRALPLLNKL